MSENKPVLGLLPRKMAEEFYHNERVIEIMDAIKRYVEVGKPVPPEWNTELDDHLEWRVTR